MSPASGSDETRSNQTEPDRIDSSGDGAAGRDGRLLDLPFTTPQYSSLRNVAAG